MLIALFLIQRTARRGVGRLFGPVMLVWFVVARPCSGWCTSSTNPAVLAALNPLLRPALSARTRLARRSWSLGAVVLAVTGAEALYADMGHFGRKPDPGAWFCLRHCRRWLLNYFGQGALSCSRPRPSNNPFFLLAPGWALMPLVLLATLATVIASQAVISGAFSLTQQAIQLGYLPAAAHPAHLRDADAARSTAGSEYACC